MPISLARTKTVACEFPSVGAPQSPPSRGSGRARVPCRPRSRPCLARGSLSIEGATKSKGVRVQSVPARLYLDPALAPFFVAGYETGARS